MLGGFNWGTFFGSFEKLLSPIKVWGFSYSLQIFEEKKYFPYSQGALGGAPLSEFSFGKIFSPKKVGGGFSWGTSFRFQLIKFFYFFYIQNMHIYSVKCYEQTNKRTPTIIYIDESKMCC